MNNNENNNEILSFEQLREKLGMNNEPPKKEKAPKAPSAQENTEPESTDELFEQIEKTLSEESERVEAIETAEAAEPRHIVENGKTFVDITEQYVTKSYVEEPVQNDEIPEESPVVVPVAPKKKKVRTFNEIFSDFFKGFIPLKKDSTKEKIRKIIMDAAIITIICCCFAFGDLFVERQLQLQQKEEIEGAIIETDDFDDNQYVEAWQDVFAKYPTIQFPEDMNLKYSYLYAVNQDLVGWVKIANTNLDVQVVQASDNNYYLNRDFYGKTSRYGCPYLDFKNDPRYLDDNTVIYGHHMTDGLMFSNLDKYKSLEGYKESPIIEYSTLYETYYFKVFAAFISNAKISDDSGRFFNFIVTDFATDEKFIGFVDEVEKRSIFNTGVTIQPDDKLITLVTCSYEFDSARLVVMGRLLRENEEPYVDVSEASINTTPKYPQAWYDAKNMDNPYADDVCWTP